MVNPSIKLKVFVGKETRPGEQRIAATPETVKRMIAAGCAVDVETGAGTGAFIGDEQFTAAGAQVRQDPAAALAEADVVLRVTPDASGGQGLKPGALLIGLLAPAHNLDLVQALTSARVSAIAMELIPRITRAQEMDALSSQASIAGYKAVLLAASRLGKYFPLLMTAAGTIAPAKVVIMGAGVAGLQAVATAKRLGAVVEVSDIRPVVKEQVESLGGKFIPLPPTESGEGEGGYARQVSEDFLQKQREIVSRHVAAANVVICTALVPGKKAPILLTRTMVEAMHPGAVVVDLAVEQGGNCELSRADSEVVHQGVLILGPQDLAAATAMDASQLYARNVWALLKPMLQDGGLKLDLADEIIDDALLTHDGEVRHAPTRQLLSNA